MSTLTYHKPHAEPLTGEIFVKWRTLMGFTQRDASSALGCSRGAIVSWEANETRIPRYIGLAMGALALGMTPYGQADEAA